MKQHAEEKTADVGGRDINRQQLAPQIVPSQYIEVELFIGGRWSPLTSVPLILRPVTYTGELKILFELVNAIEQIQISAQDFLRQSYQKDAIQLRIDNLTKKLHELMQLSCLHHQKKEIHDMTCLFFESTLESIQLTPVAPGTPGHSTYVEQQKILDGAIQIVRRALQIEDFHLVGPLPSLIKPTTESLSAFLDLPQDIESFANSLEDFRGWATRLNAYQNNVARFNDYALLIQSEMQRLQHDDRLFLIQKIRILVKELRRFSLPEILVNAFENIALGSISPQRLYRVGTLHSKRQSEFDAQVDILKNKIEGFLTENLSGEDFDKHLKRFREKLSMALQQFPDKKQVILSELKAFIDSFHISKGPMLTLAKYIQACMDRIASPLPKHLSDVYTKLLIRYQRAGATYEQQLKLTFLMAWIEEIHRSPEKTYSDCFHFIKKGVNEATKEILSRKQSRFWTHHQAFTMFRKQLLASDRDVIKFEHPQHAKSTNIRTYLPGR